jgi:hypothetical protein
MFNIVVLVTLAVAFLGLVMALIRDYLKIAKIWPRRYDPIVVESISITGTLIGLAQTAVYLILVAFVYNDWLVTARTSSDMIRSIIMGVIGIGLWVPLNNGISWYILLKRRFMNRNVSYEIVIIPTTPAQVAHVQDHYPSAEYVSRHGGQVFVLDCFETQSTAEEKLATYSDLGMYMLVLPVEAY